MVLLFLAWLLFVVFVVAVAVVVGCCRSFIMLAYDCWLLLDMDFDFRLLVSLFVDDASVVAVVVVVVVSCYCCLLLV